VPLTERDNYLRNATLSGGEWIPCTVVISGASWDELREEMEEVIVRHPTLFPDFVPGQRDYDNWDFGPAQRAGELFTDAWGCQWRSAIDGIEGVVINHPLSDWEALDDYEPPNPMVEGDRGPVDWVEIHQGLQAARREGKVTIGGLVHGHLFMRLAYLRGFENLMLDMATDEPRLYELIDIIVEHSLVIIDQYLEAGVDVMSLPEDLGTQQSSVMGPRMFEKWIAPAYRRLIEPCHKAGTLVHMHSDGYIMDIMDELLACGVDIINPQDLVNGIDALRDSLKGRVCIDLDIDRQKIVPYGTRQEIQNLIEEEVRKLGSPQGGLMLIVGIYPPTPPQNIDAVCDAMEQFRTYWFDGRGC